MKKTVNKLGIKKDADVRDSELEKEIGTLNLRPTKYKQCVVHIKEFFWF